MFDPNLIATLTRLRQAIGVGVLRVRFADSIAGSIVLLALSGFILWTRLDRRRLAGLALMLASFGLARRGGAAIVLIPQGDRGECAAAVPRESLLVTAGATCRVDLYQTLLNPHLTGVMRMTIIRTWICNRTSSASSQVMLCARRRRCGSRRFPARLSSGASAS